MSLRETWLYWLWGIGGCVVLVFGFLPGDEETGYFQWFMVTVGFAVPLGCSLAVLAWRRYHRRTPAPRVITHADGTRARVDGTGKGYERLAASHETPSAGMMDSALEWLGRLF